MMKTYHVMAAENSRYQTEAWAVKCGEDLSVTICGGSRYHVGAAALGCARPLYEGKPRRSATVSVICAFEHKDDEVARWAARYLATELDCRVSVSAGVHIDDAAVEELQILMDKSKEVCDKLITAVNEDKNN
jgi:hypothetical protein